MMTRAPLTSTHKCSGVWVTAWRREKTPWKPSTFFKGNPYGFDLVIADEMTPRMRGTEIMARIRDIRPDIPAMIITAGLELDKTRERAEDLRISHALLKPLSRSDMADAIERLVCQSQGEESTFSKVSPGAAPKAR